MLPQHTQGPDTNIEVDLNSRTMSRGSQQRNGSSAQKNTTLPQVRQRGASQDPNFMSSSGSKKLGSVRAGASLKASLHGDEMGEMSPA